MAKLIIEENAKYVYAIMESVWVYLNGSEKVTDKN
jgi:hypothetical protein